MTKRGVFVQALDMMIRSLVENGFLIATAPRKHEITPKGEKFAEGKK